MKGYYETGDEPKPPVEQPASVLDPCRTQVPEDGEITWNVGLAPSGQLRFTNYAGKVLRELNGHRRIRRYTEADPVASLFGTYDACNNTGYSIRVVGLLLHENSYHDDLLTEKQP